MAKTLSQLRQLVRQKADIENSGKHITDDEIDDYINQSIQSLHSLVVDGTDGTLFAKNAPVLEKVGDNSYLLPSDFDKLVSVDIQVTGNWYSRSIQADPQEYAQLATQTYHGQDDTRHMLRYSLDQGVFELYVFPAPPNNSDIAVQYIPSPQVLDADSEVLNLPTFWFQWVVLDAAMACGVKDESINTIAISSEREKVERRIRDHIRSMSVTRIKTIRQPGRFFRTVPSIYSRGG